MLSRLELKIPPVAVFLLCFALMWLISSQVSTTTFSLPGRRLIAAVLLAIGLATGAAGLLAFRSAQTSVDPRYPDKAKTVVRSGIFRYSRNPMYVGLLLVLFAWGAWLSHGLALVGLPVFVIYMNRFQILPEERVLSSQFGEPYTDYLRAVRRWLYPG